jgi:hypothetical protein
MRHFMVSFCALVTTFVLSTPNCVLASEPTIGSDDRSAVAAPPAADPALLPLFARGVEALQANGGSLNPLQALTGTLNTSNVSPAEAGRAFEPPKRLVHVRISRDYLRQFIERKFEKDDAVIDEILGTALKGKAHTTAQVKLSLEPSPARAVLVIVSTGTIDMTTRGVNGPVILHSNGETHFEAKKTIVFDRTGIVSRPAVAIAETTLTTRGLESTLPGMRGRLVERIGWKQVAETRGEAESIAAEHAQVQIARCLDEEVDHALVAIRQLATEQLAGLPSSADGTPRVARFATTRSHLHFAIDHGAASDQSWDDLAAGEVAIMARIHRIAVQEAVRNPRFAKLLPLLVSQLPDARTGGPAGSQPAVSWSPDGQWLLVQVKACDQTPERSALPLEAKLPVGPPALPLADAKPR